MGSIQGGNIIAPPMSPASSRDSVAIPPAGKWTLEVSELLGGK